MPVDFLDKLGLRVHYHLCYLSYDTRYVVAPLSCEIIYVRHGETYGNRYRLFQGFADETNDTETGMNELTELGITQAAAVARGLEETHSGWMPDTVLVSPLKRARRTAEIMLGEMRYQGIPRFSDDLREINFGEWENKTLAQIPQDYRETARRYLMSDACAKAPSGESFIELLHRADRVIRHIHTSYPGKRVLIVAHGTLGNAIRLLRRQLIVHQDGYIRWHGEENFLPNAIPVKIS